MEVTVTEERRSGTDSCPQLARGCPCPIEECSFVVGACYIRLAAPAAVETRLSDGANDEHKTLSVLFRDHSRKRLTALWGLRARPRLGS